jgi:hypothetical protein
MGIPYSRQINAAFEQVTPLVAAGFKVLRTTRDISILLAIIQVLTVVLLFAILLALIGVLYCVNPDLEVTYQPGVLWDADLTDVWQYERTTVVTPWLRSIARITLYGIIKSLVSTGLVLGVIAWAVWKMFLVKQWVEDVEYEGNVDADEALGELDGEKDKEDEEEKGKKNGKGKGKGGKK